MFPAKSLLSRCVAAVLLIAGARAHSEPRLFNVPAQPAVMAIPEFARQAGVQIVAPAGQLRGIRTPAVVGEMEVRAALTQLLAGTQLTIDSDEGGIVTLINASTAVRAGSAEELGTGVIEGRVLDVATGEYLRNAIVRVTSDSGVRQSTTTGERGEYRVVGLPAGTFEVSVSFTGRSDRNATVTLQAGESTQLDFDLLRLGSTEEVLEEITVSAGTLDGDARAIMSQRESMDIKNSLSSEAFGDISEGNVGEFIKYMPGVDTDGVDGTVRTVRLRGLPPEYTSVTINGVELASADANLGSSASRTFSFEQVSLSSIDAIEISKTVSADVDANAPAGTINLRTKRAFDRNGRRIAGQLSASTQSDLWDDQDGGPGDADQDRFLPGAQLEYSDVLFNNRLGVLLSLSDSETYIQQERMTLGWDFTPTAANSNAAALAAMRAQQINQTTERFATSLTLDFKATDRLILSLLTMYNESDLWSGQRSWLFTTGDRSMAVTGDVLTDFTTRHSSARANAESLAVAKRGRIVSAIPSFEWTGDRVTLDGRVAHSSSTSRYDPLDWHGSVFSVGSLQASGAFSAERSSLAEPDWTITQLNGADWSNPASYSRPVIQAEDGRYAESKLDSAAMNLTFKAWLAPTAVTFKTGFKLARNTYDFGNEREAHQYTYVGPLTVSQFWQNYASPVQMSFDDNDFHLTTTSGAARLFMPSNHQIGQLLLSHPEYFTRTLTAANYYTAYIANVRHFEEDQNAAYLMGTVNFSERMSLRAGVRWEQTETRARQTDPLSYAEVVAAGYAASAATGRATTIDGLKYQYESRPKVDRRGRYDYFFPSASLKYSFDGRTELQLAYSKTIRRPQVNVLAGVQTVDESERIVSVPNPGLEPELSDNLSMRAVHYFEPSGLFAINLFQNEIHGLFQTVDLTAEEYGYSGGIYDDYTFRTTRSVSDDTIAVRGAELEYQQSFDFLPGPFRGLSLRSSYTFNEAEETMLGMARHLVTAALSYSRGGFGLNLNTVWSDDKPYDSTGVVVDDRVEANLSASYQFNRQWQVFFSVRNLLDSPYRRTVPAQDGVASLNAYYQKFGRTSTLGFRAAF